MAARTDGPVITRRRSVLACARCRARRVKCDRAQPSCSNCFKTGALCLPGRRQESPSSMSVSSNFGQREQAEYGQLPNLEQKMAGLSQDADGTSPSRGRAHTPTLDEESNRRAQTFRGSMFSGPNSRYFGPFSWAAVAEEISESDSAINGCLPVYSPPSTSTSRDPRLSLPGEALHDTLLGFFHKRVDPLIRLLHWPSFLEQSHAFRQAVLAQNLELAETPFQRSSYPESGYGPQQQPHYQRVPMVPSQRSLPRTQAHKISSYSDFAGLLYAVYYAAVVSLLEDPSQPQLGTNINNYNLARTYKREATSRVAPTGTSVNGSLESLQAMVLMLAVEPEAFDAQSQRLQLSATITRARELGLHRDAAGFGFSTKDTELRRRLWALICVLDVGYTEYLGYETLIGADTYNTMLPVGVHDEDLDKMEGNEAGKTMPQETAFTPQQEIRQAQQGQVSVSPMVFALIRTEIARLQVSLTSISYHANDALPFHSRVTRSGLRAPADKIAWIEQTERRLKSVYALDRVETSNPLHQLASEYASLSLAKATFMVRVMEWREEYSTMGMGRKETETTRLFHDAIGIATRTLSVMQQFSKTNYNWYMKRIRDTHSSAFLGLNLAFGRYVDEQSMGLGHSVLIQLFPTDSGGNFHEVGLHKSVFGRIISKGLGKREAFSKPPVSDNHTQTVQAGNISGTDIFPQRMRLGAVSLPPTHPGDNSFPMGTDMIGNLDPVIDNSTLWPSGSAESGNSFPPWIWQNH